MITEFEPVYRFLDLPDDATAAAVRDALARRKATLEEQEASAGSRPERLMAKKLLRELGEKTPDIERLSACLEVGEHLADARAAIAERRGSRARRALGYAAECAARSGLEAFIRSVAEVEDEFADSGLARDTAFESEVDEVEAQIETWTRSVASGLAAGGTPVAALVAELPVLQARLSSLSSRGSGRADAGLRARIEGFAGRLQAGAASLAHWQAAHGLQQELEKTAAARTRLEEVFSNEERDRAAPADLGRAATEIEALLAAPLWSSPAPSPALASRLEQEREALSRLRALLASAQVRRTIILELQAIELEVARGSGDEAIAGRIEAVQRRIAEAGLEELGERCQVVLQGLEKARRRARIEAALAPLEAAARAGLLDGTFLPQLEEAEALAASGEHDEFAERLAALRARLAEREKLARAVPPPLSPPPPRPEAPPPESPAPANLADPPRADRFTLIGPEGERCHVVCADRVLFGRSPTCDVVLRAYHPSNREDEHRVSTSISRRQFTIVKEPDDALLVDGGPSPDGKWQASANETFEPGGRAIERVKLFRTGLATFAVVRSAAPVASPQWDVQMQMRARLPAALSSLRDAVAPGPDSLYLRRTDGLCEDVLIVWRAANLQDFGLTETPVHLVRRAPGFMLGQDESILPLETGFRIGRTWTVASLGALNFRA